MQAAGGCMKILILALILFVLPHYLRSTFGNNTLAGIEPYLQLTGQPSTLYQYIIQTLDIYGTIWVVIFQIMLGLASILLLQRILARFNVPTSQQQLTILTYTLSPTLLAATFMPNPQILAFLLLGLGVLAPNLALTSILFGLATLNGSTFGLAALALLVLLRVTKKTSYLAGILPALLLLLPLPFTFTQSFSFIEIHGTGYSLFIFLLALVGIFFAKKSLIFAGLPLFTLAIFSPDLLLIGATLLAILAGTALNRLAHRTWRVTLLRNATLAVIFASLLFGTLSYATYLSAQPPTPDFFAALPELSTTILTHSLYNPLIHYANHQTPTIPPNELALLFNTTEPAYALDLLHSYNITHVLITSEMTLGLVWERPGLGLHFLLQNNENFKRIPSGSSFEVYTVS